MECSALVPFIRCHPYPLHFIEMIFPLVHLRKVSPQCIIIRGQFVGVNKPSLVGVNKPSSLILMPIDITALRV